MSSRLCVDDTCACSIEPQVAVRHTVSMLQIPIFGVDNCAAGYKSELV
jgi:hypothetical protein